MVFHSKMVIMHVMQNGHMAECHYGHMVCHGRIKCNKIITKTAMMIYFKLILDDGSFAH